MPVIIMLPARRMAQVAFEVVKSRYGRPFPVFQQPSSIQQDVSRAFEDLLLRWDVWVGDFEVKVPFATGFVPDGGDEAMIVLDVLPNAVLLCNGLQVAVNLDTSYVVARVVWIWFLPNVRKIDSYEILDQVLTKRVDVCMSWYITSAARISVFQPCTAKIVIFFVYIKVNVLYGFLNAYRRCESGNTCADAHNAETRQRVEWTSFGKHIRFPIGCAIHLSFSSQRLLLNAERHLDVL